MLVKIVRSTRLNNKSINLNILFLIMAKIIYMGKAIATYLGMLEKVPENVGIITASQEKMR